MGSGVQLSRSLSDPRVSNRSQHYVADFQMLHPSLKSPVDEEIQQFKKRQEERGETMETSFSGTKETNARKSRRRACII